VRFDDPQNILIQGIPQIMPFGLDDWATPQRARHTRFDDVPNTLVAGIPQQMPFGLDDWVTPLRARQTRFDDPPNALASGIPQQMPFGTDDWATPIRVRPSGFDHPPNALITYSVAQIPPFGQDDWPNPIPRKGVSVEQTVRFAAPIPGPAPFSQLDWVTPLRARRDVGGFECDPFNTLILTVVAPPFGQSDWPNPRRFRYSPASLDGNEFPLPFQIPVIPLYPLPVTVGLPLATAEQTLTLAGFGAGTLSFSSSQSVQPGIVLVSVPAAGTLEPLGFKVNLTISSGAVSPVTKTPTQRATTGDLPQRIPPPNHLLVDSAGRPAASWWRFILNISQQALGTGTQAEASVPVTASPFLYTAPVNGTLLVNGGPVTLIEYSHNGSPFYPLGQVGGQIQVFQFDEVRITYLNAPSLTFFPR